MRLLTHIDAVLAYQPKAARRRQITGSVSPCSSFWLYIIHGENPQHRDPNEIGLSSEVAHAIEKAIITHFGFFNLAGVAGNGCQTAIYDKMPSRANHQSVSEDQSSSKRHHPKYGRNLGASLSHFFCSQLVWFSLQRRAQVFLLNTFVNLTASRHEMGRTNSHDSITVWISLAKRTTFYARY